MGTAKLPGGAYLAADGKTWHDGNGKIIDSPISVNEGANVLPPVVPEPVVEKPLHVDAKVTPAGKAKVTPAPSDLASETDK